MFDVNKALKQRQVSCVRGAPLGRIEYVRDPGALVYLQRVIFEDDCYDLGGAYWGVGEPLYCAMDEAGQVLVFLRAPDFPKAVNDLCVLHPHLIPCVHQPAPLDARRWCDGHGFIELQIGLQDAGGGSHSGACDADIAALSREPYISAQLAALDIGTVKDVLRDYGFQDVAYHHENLQRLLWLACGDIAEGQCEPEES